MRLIARDFEVARYVAVAPGAGQGALIGEAQFIQIAIICDAEIPLSGKGGVWGCRRGLRQSPTALTDASHRGEFLRPI